MQKGCLVSISYIDCLENVLNHSAVIVLLEMQPDVVSRNVVHHVNFGTENLLLLALLLHPDAISLHLARFHLVEEQLVLDVLIPCMSDNCGITW